jgi:predicted lipase
MADLCCLSYVGPNQTEDDWRGTLEHWAGVNPLKFWRRGGTEMFGIVRNGDAFICVRGTAGSYDWITNSRFGKVNGPLMIGDRVHRGFYESAASTFQLVERWVDELPISTNLFLCGHSLGAAVATVFASMLTARRYPVAGLLAESSPRVGNRKFAREMSHQLGGNWIRTQICRDLVPRVPPLFWGYHHGGKHVYIDRMRQCHIKPALTYQLHDRLMESLSDLAKGELFRGFTDDHSCMLNHQIIGKHAEKIVET